MKKRDHLARYVFIGVIIVAFAIAAIVRLINIDVTGQGYTENPSTSGLVTRTETIQALRGEIFDRNGKPLVTNDYYYEIYLDAGSLPRDNTSRNGVILSLLNEAKEHGEDGAFTLPDHPFLEIANSSGTEINYEYDSSYMETVYGSRLRRLILEITEKEEMPEAKDARDILRERYGLVDGNGDAVYGADDDAVLFRIRTDMELRNFSPTEPYTILKDVSLKLITVVDEDMFRGVQNRKVVKRVYPYPGVASHILGRCGRIQASNAEYYADLGYPVDAVVGLTGAEGAFEEYLHGTDGERTIVEDEYGNVIDEYVSKEPIPGSNVYLTIDIDLQADAEAALKNDIDLIIENAKVEIAKDPETECVGEDANAGALTLLDVKTGEVLAAATYPTFNLETFDEDYASLLKDENAPLFNRALEGTYPPGSTFKPGVAAAALEEGVITPYTEFECAGKYGYYKDTGFEPACWIYNMYRGRHGYLNVSDAVKVSCNCFFYETGRLLTIKNMNRYCKGYGLGQPTGSEISEKTGVLAGPEYREANGLEAWTDGQTITAAIGQSDNLFTPLQMSVYISTLVNRGTRYKVHFLYQVREFYTGNIVYQSEPEVYDSSITLSDGNVAVVLNAMKDVVEDQTGSASRVFADFPITIGGKTGTAQVDKTRSDNAVFTAFAPFDSPEVAAACVIEHGSSGSMAGYAVKDTFASYFGVKTAAEDDGKEDGGTDADADEGNGGENDEN